MRLVLALFALVFAHPAYAATISVTGSVTEILFFGDTNASFEPDDPALANWSEAEVLSTSGTLQFIESDNAGYFTAVNCTGLALLVCDGGETETLYTYSEGTAGTQVTFSPQGYLYVDDGPWVWDEYNFQDGVRLTVEFATFDVPLPASLPLFMLALCTLWMGCRRE